MQPPWVLIVTPSMDGAAGRWAEMIQGALARKGCNVRIASGDHRGSGFADHKVIQPACCPWFFRVCFALEGFLHRQFRDFPFHLLVWIGSARDFPSSFQKQHPSLPIFTVELSRDGAGHLQPLSRTTPKKLPHGGRKVFDDDIAGRELARQFAGENPWNKEELAALLLGSTGPRSRQPAHDFPEGARTGSKGICLDLCFGGEDNLCHWISYSLASILEARLSGHTVAEILLPAAPNEFQLSSLAWLEIKPQQIRFSRHPGQKWVKIWPQSREITGELRRIFLRNASREHSAPFLYLSRSDASYRRVRNEAAMVRLIARHGFVRKVAGDLPLANQVAMFRDARRILTPHGAALKLLFCCSPGTELIELMPGHEERNHFQELAREYAVAHERLACPWSGRQTSRRREADLVVPLDCLARFLESKDRSP